jgi:CHAT domain-containing protein/tetratricopeptide (TPR) repeat protein
MQGRWPEAARTLDEALTQARTALSGDKDAFSIFLNNAAELLRRRNELEKARPLYEEAIALRRSAGLHDRKLAQFLHNLAFLYQQSADSTPAEVLLQESLAISRNLVPPDLALVAQTLNNIGVYYHRRGEEARAREAYQEALRLRTTAAGSDTIDQETAISNLAELELSVGNDPAAKALFDRIDEIRPAGELDEVDRVRRLGRVASLYERLGKYDAAERLTLQVIDFVRRGRGADSPDFARARAELAGIYARQGRTEEAEQLFLDVIEHMRGGGGFDDEDLSTALNNLGLFYYELGRNAEAEQLITEVIERRRALAADDPALLDGLNNLGLILTAQKRYDEAESILREVLEARRRVLFPNHPNIAQSLFNLGMLYSDMGRVAEALPLLREQFEAEDRLLASVFSVASEEERLAYAAKLRDNLNVFLMKMIFWEDRPDAVAIAFDTVLRRKGIVAEAAAMERATVLASGGPIERQLLEELHAVLDRLARGILDGPVADGAGHEAELARLDGERERLETRLARAVAGTGGATRTLADRALVAAALPTDSALLEFVRFSLVANGLHADEERDAYAVLVLLDGEPENATLHNLGLAEDMEAGVALFRGTITQDGEVFRRLRNVDLDTVDVAATEISIGTGLRKVLIDRVRPRLGSRKRVFIAPDGILNRLPFETLPGEDGGYLGEEFEISYLSSGRDLLRIHTAPGHQDGTAVVVADPDYDLDPTDAATTTSTSSEMPGLRSMGLHFDPLPDTREEGTWVAARLGGELWSGAQALETKVKGCESPRILHLATHGFVLDRRPQRGTPSTPGEAGAVPTGQPADRLGENPLLRSGLALAGANRWLEGQLLSAEAEDGLLLAADVSYMRLHGTSLVVLSACETGLGEYRIGEGVFGLRRAFELAGARSLVMSLWRVPSGPTRELMQEFYRQLSRGKRRSEALREAQRILRRRYPQTFYWGAFVLSGDPSPMQL